jgi:hypothetical protein
MYKDNNKTQAGKRMILPDHQMKPERTASGPPLLQPETDLPEKLHPDGQKMARGPHAQATSQRVKATLRA